MFSLANVRGFIPNPFPTISFSALSHKNHGPQDVSATVKLFFTFREQENSSAKPSRPSSRAPACALLHLADAGGEPFGPGVYAGSLGGRDGENGNAGVELLHGRVKGLAVEIEHGHGVNLV